MYVGHTVCLLPQAIAVNLHLISIIVYLGLDRDQLTCSIQWKKRTGDKMIKNMAEEDAIEEQCF